MLMLYQKLNITKIAYALSFFNVSLSYNKSFLHEKRVFYKKNLLKGFKKFFDYLKKIYKKHSKIIFFFKFYKKTIFFVVLPKNKKLQNIPKL